MATQQKEPYDFAGQMWLMRQQRIVNGLCPNCGEVNDQDHYYCSKCEPLREDYERRLNRNKKDQGICSDCQGELDRDGFYCSKCLPSITLATRRYKKQYLDQGLCPRCREHNPIVPGLKYCQDCRDKQTADQTSVQAVW